MGRLSLRRIIWLIRSRFHVMFLAIQGGAAVSDGPDGSETARPNLFQPFTIRGLTLKNRLVVPPMVHYRCESGNTCGTFHVVHLGRYALGGFGLVFVEATAVEETGLINEHDLRSEEHTSELQSLRHLVCRLL